MFLPLAENIKKMDKLAPGEHYDIIVLDGTWRQAKDIFHKHVFRKVETILRWNLHFEKRFFFPNITAEHQDCPVLTVFLAMKTSSQNNSQTLS